MAQAYFAEIILPLALPGTFTYEVSEEQMKQLKTGHRVSIPFGSNKLYTGIIHSFHQDKPELFKTKKIDSVLDKEPMVTQKQIQFWEWIAGYYMCTLGEVYRNAFPSALKWESETMVRFSGLNPDEDDDFSDDEKIVMHAISQKALISVSEIAKIIERKSAIPVIKSLWEKGIVRLDEVLVEKYSPKVELFLRVKPGLKKDEKLFNESMDRLKNANRQRELLLQLIVEEQQSSKPVKVSGFLKVRNGSHAALRSMEEKGLIEIYENKISRIEEEKNQISGIEQLTHEQNQALNSIAHYFETGKTVLLQGVTSSGKTQIYIKLIENALKQQNTVLFLLPEISIVSQMVQRIRKYFGEIVGIYHSKFNQNERVELWQKTLDREYRIVIGARSSLLLPFSDLGLVIVDEEHETAYKQNDFKPFFNARDMAIVLGRQFNGNVILGSATPSLESFYNAQTGKFGFVELTQRYSAVELPKIELVDIRNALKTKQITGDITHILRDAIQEAVNHGKQVLIFQNRRGFAPIVECLNCGFTPYCPNCDVPLTYHKFSNTLRCHYCGHSQSNLNKCPQCQSFELTTKGIGTQQIEMQLQALFPKLKIARMDIDSMRKKHAYEKTIEAFEQQEIDILIGTQMIAKGLDFQNIGLVGIIRADSILNFPDFRAHEKAFQLLTQVAGRSGRRNEQGKVLIQTYNPNHEILQNVIHYDYKKMAKEVLYERKSFLYPPFLRLIQLTFRHSNREKSEKVAKQFVELIKPFIDEKHLLGPEAPAINRIRNFYIQVVMVKIPKGVSAKGIKSLIGQTIERINSVKSFRSVRIDMDVDPL